MSAPRARYLTGDPAGLKDFIDRFDVFLFDCDGVLWGGDHVFPGAVETLRMLRSRGKRIIFVTNNSTKSRADYRAKLLELGIPATTDEVVGSAYSAAIYISRILQIAPPKNKVFVLGQSGIMDELALEGVPCVGGADPAFRRDMVQADFEGIADGSHLDDDVGVVLVGGDRYVNYLKLAHAAHYLRRGALFLATNTDSTLPMLNTVFPGAGSCFAPLITMTGRHPESLGKPSTKMMDAIESGFKFDRSRACMVGDRLETDIRFGIEGRLGGTLAVQTGVNKKEDWEVEGEKYVPGWYVDAIGDLLAVDS